nr:MAG TPA: hypothetical protein [Caudoviricetes sp.]
MTVSKSLRSIPFFTITFSGRNFRPTRSNQYISFRSEDFGLLVSLISKFSRSFCNSFRLSSFRSGRHFNFGFAVDCVFEALTYFESRACSGSNGNTLTSHRVEAWAFILVSGGESAETTQFNFFAFSNGAHDSVQQVVNDLFSFHFSQAILFSSQVNQVSTIHCLFP